MCVCGRSYIHARTHARTHDTRGAVEQNLLDLLFELLLELFTNEIAFLDALFLSVEGLTNACENFSTVSVLLLFACPAQKHYSADF